MRITHYPDIVISTLSSLARRDFDNDEFWESVITLDVKYLFINWKKDWNKKFNYYSTFLQA